MHLIDPPHIYACGAGEPSAPNAREDDIAPGPCGSLSLQGSLKVSGLDDCIFRESLNAYLIIFEPLIYSTNKPCTP